MIKSNDSGVLRTFAFALLLTDCVFLNLSAQSAEIAWVNPDGGDWDVVSNWNPAQIPGSSDTAVISLEGTYSVALSAPTTLAGLVVGGNNGKQTLSVSAQNLTLSGPAAINPSGVFVLDGGTVASSSSITVSGAFEWISGNVSGSGTLAVNQAATLRFASNNPKGLDAGRVLENNGTVLWEDGEINLNATPVGGSGRIENKGVFEIQAGVRAITFSPFADSREIPLPVFENPGLVRRGVSSDTASMDVRFNNSGTTRVETGALRFTKDGVNTGTFDVAFGATLSPRTYTFAQGSTLTGAGRYRFESGTQTFNADHTIANAEFSFGMIAGAGNLTISSVMNWSGGTMSGAGRTIIPEGATLNLTSISTKGLDSGRALENHGLIVWHDGDINLNTIEGGGSGKIVNAAGGLFEIRASRSILTTSFVDQIIPPLASFSNLGTVRRTTATGMTTADIVVPFYNNGAVQAQSGVLRLSGWGSNSGSFDVSAGATFAIGTYLFDQGSTLTGGGKFLFDTGTQEFLVDQTIPNLEKTAGLIMGPANLTIANSMTWSAGIISGSARTIIAPAATLTLTSSNLKDLDGGRVLENRGTIIWQDGDIDLNATFRDGSAAIANLAGALFEIRCNNRSIFASIHEDSATLPLPLFSNAGTIRRTSGSDVATIAVPLESSGTIQGLIGTLRISGEVINTGAFEVEEAATLAAGTLTFNAGSALSGAGRFLFDAGTQTFAVDHTIPNIEMRGGTLGGPGNLTVAKKLIWGAGTMSGDARTIIATTATATLTSASAKGLDAARVYENHGTTIWDEGDINLNAGSSGGSGKIENREGLFEIRGNNRIFASAYADTFPSPSFSNQAAIRRSSGILTTALIVPFTNSGSVSVETGTLRLQSGGNNLGALTVSPAATFAPQTFSFNQGSTFGGAGAYLFDTGTATFTADVTIPVIVMTAGSIAGAGNVTISDNMDWTGGTMTGSGHTIVSLGASLTIKGTTAKGLDAGRVLENRGAIGWFDGDINLNAGPSGGSGQIENTALGTFNISAPNRTILVNNNFPDRNAAPLPAFINAGTVLVMALTTAGKISVPFNNSGLIQMFSGTLDFSGGLNLQAAGKIAFLMSELAVPGQIRVTGDLSINGELTFYISDAFNPPNGTIYEVISVTGARTGAFATINGNSHSNGISLNPSYDPKAVEVTVLNSRPVLTAGVALPGPQFRLTGLAGESYLIEASTTLLPDDWAVIETIALPLEGFLDYVDPNTNLHPFRFYRVSFIP